MAGPASHSLMGFSDLMYIRTRVTVANVAALTGKALSNVDVRPLENTLKPSTW